MTKNTRRRTDAQRKKRDEDEAADVDSRPLTEEEQDAEIRAIRIKSENDKRVARKWLDGLVVAGIVMTLRKAIDSPPLSRTIQFAQVLLLLLSLSPGRVLPPELSYLAAYHPFVTAAQLTLFLVGLLGTGGDTDPSQGSQGLLQTVRWAVPELIAGAVEMQRRAERDNEEGLQRVERLRYNLKGA